MTRNMWPLLSRTRHAIGHVTVCHVARRWSSVSSATAHQPPSNRASTIIMESAPARSSLIHAVAEQKQMYSVHEVVDWVRAERAHDVVALDVRHARAAWHPTRHLRHTLPYVLCSATITASATRRCRKSWGVRSAATLWSPPPIPHDT